jgi:cation diffusion facilitator CzcD-associated flavoprotein CzcO
VVSAAGALSEPRAPAIPGIDEFAGPTFHSAAWDHDTSLAGKRVAVIGTGASAIQIVPKIQPEAETLEVYQRTPAWIIPRTDRPFTRLERQLYRRFPALQRVVRGAIYWSRETYVVAFTRRKELLGCRSGSPRRTWPSRSPTPCCARSCGRTTASAASAS